ncbi:MAG: hypothetical protein U0804_19830 [Gemmataceae bacterium]
MAYWIEFKSPPPYATWLTTRFGSGGVNPERMLPDVVLNLPPGKAGSMVALTFAADAGAAVLDETIDLTVGGGSVRLRMTRDKPRAETTVIVPAGAEMKYAARATTRVSLNNNEATYQGVGDGTYVPPADRRLVYVRDTAAGFNNFRALF